LEAKHRTICLDELGPVAVRDYPFACWIEGEHRPQFEPNYERRGFIWVLGALEPAVGHAHTAWYEQRTRFEVVDLLDQLPEAFQIQPDEKVSLIIDNLPAHKALDVMLWNWGHPQFRFVWMPTHAAWLNLIEPWWRIPKNWALKGSRYQTKEEAGQAILDATALWNQHPKPYRWKKKYY